MLAVDEIQLFSKSKIHLKLIPALSLLPSAVVTSLKMNSFKNDLMVIKNKKYFKNKEDLLLVSLLIPWNWSRIGNTFYLVLGFLFY